MILVKSKEFWPALFELQTIFTTFHNVLINLLFVLSLLSLPLKDLSVFCDYVVPGKRMPAGEARTPFSSER